MLIEEEAGAGVVIEAGAEGTGAAIRAAAEATRKHGRGLGRIRTSRGKLITTGREVTIRKWQGEVEVGASHPPERQNVLALVFAVPVNKSSLRNLCTNSVKCTNFCGYASNAC